MRKLYHIIYIGVVLLLMSSCTEAPRDAQPVGRQPKIYPDYTDVTIPAGIAPLNFCLAESGTEQIYVVAKGSKGGEIHASGDYADFDIDAWHELTALNVGAGLKVTVYAKQAGVWRQYSDFHMHVSRYPLEDYGLTYRRIPPGYEVGGNIGLYQRDIHSFEETPVFTETALPGKCFNCHTANKTDPRQVTLQVRGEGGGTLVQIDGRQQWYNTKTDETRAAGSYAYWHPEGRYVAYATNSVHQSFFVGKEKPLEVFHLFSDIVLLDTQTSELLLDSLLRTDDLEIFPAFSAGGRTLYYSSSKPCDMPGDYLKVKCSLCAIGFDAKTGRFSEQVDTLLNGPLAGYSYVLARPSYDGRWLMYVRCSRSNFPIAQKDADLCLMDLKTRKTWELKEVNSRWTESYPNWSSNSHWFVCSSKRGDGMYTRLYISSIDDKGRATKPFLLPQRNPWKYYHQLFDAYNCPDFTKQRVEIDIREARCHLFGNERVPVKTKETK